MLHSQKRYYINRDHKYKTVLKHHNNVNTNWYMRKIVARGVEIGGGKKVLLDRL